MAEESFMLVSLKEENAKKLAQVISNDTCRKILEFLAKNKATETELSEKLNIPISTVHYNLEQLLKSKLVEANEFHYSKKGKEVIHYSLANKYIIIAPKEDACLLKKLKEILPAAIIGFVSSAMLYFYSMFSYSKNLALAGKSGIRDGTEALKNSIPAAEAGEAIQSTGLDSAKVMQESFKEAVINKTIPQTQFLYNDIAFWFFLGVFVTVSGYIIWNIVKNKFKKQ